MRLREVVYLPAAHTVLRGKARSRATVSSGRPDLSLDTS